MIERKIGEIFIYNGQNVKIIKSISCLGCMFHNERDTSLNEIYNRNWYYHTYSFNKVIEHLYNGGAVCWLKYPDAMYVLDKSKIYIRNIKTNALYGAGELFKAWFEVGGLICL